MQLDVEGRLELLHHHLGRSRTRPGSTRRRSSCPPGSTSSSSSRRAHGSSTGRQPARATSMPARCSPRLRPRCATPRRPPEQRLYAAEAPAVQDCAAGLPAARAALVVGPYGRCGWSGLGRSTAPGTSSSHAPRARRSIPHAPGRSALLPNGFRVSRPWASTWSTCRRSIRSATPSARGRTTRSLRARTIPAPRGRSARRRAGMTRCTPTWGRWPTSSTSWPWPRTTAWRSPWTSRCRRPRITPGWPRTPSGSCTGPTARSPTPRTRRRSTRTSTRSPSTPTSTGSSTSASGSCACGWARACGSSGSTTRTPRPWRSGRCCSPGSTPRTPMCCSWPRRSPVPR